ncbi:Acyl-CoA desaturase [Sparassis crispa]|uniref:Acyl-CoA desaturase n=1 Tax=Sparassis crispa TaxID=139825 RepID=A0A401GWT3_9APHY|nr:Acyl-CoA desaturase [Sparassis crispa]GBE86650.1 Acyl-CoA desaturase [Sparassis crispa]
MAVVLWQLASLGITVGYHRLYSHRAFQASAGVKLLAALLGASAFQGSIKWWCLRHRLHHRFTDDPVHDPYAATRGLLWSHMGWIFFQSHYTRLDRIEKSDLERDPIVNFQHRYYVPLAVSLGLILPPVLGTLWGDPYGAFVWGGLVARLFIWHCTFLINSLAHWEGLQPYSDDNTSKTNLILALLTCGEGNHNFHAFPHDYRSGPAPFDWDPSKWVILLIHRLGFIYGLRIAREEDIQAAKAHMIRQETHTTVRQLSLPTQDAAGGNEDEDKWSGEAWTWDDVNQYVLARRGTGACMVVIDGYVVDVTGYLGEHPGGAAFLRRYSVSAIKKGGCDKETAAQSIQDLTGTDTESANWAFHGGMNKHSHAAKRRMRELRVARISDSI